MPAGIGDRVEGFHAVAAAVAAGRVTLLTVASGRVQDEDVAAVVAAARAGGAAVDVVDDLAGMAVTAAPQGLVAQARPFATIDLDAAVAATVPAAVVVLDRVEDPGNVGAVARSAAAAGFGALVVAQRRAAPIGATAFKAAAGALERLPVAIVGSTAEAVARLRRLGLWTVGLAAGAETSLFGLELLAEPAAIVVGSEGRGLSRLVAERMDVVASIPMAAEVESLNVSVAAALAMFELRRVRGLGSSGPIGA